MRPPNELPRWNDDAQSWPAGWQKLISFPLFEGLYRFVILPLRQLEALRRSNEKPSASACLNPGLHHFLIAMEVWKLQHYSISLHEVRARIRSALLKVFDRLLGGKCPPLESLGSICPWTLAPSAVRTNGLVISGGVGGDVSFELDLAARTGCRVMLFDPSATGRKTIESLHPLPREIQFFPYALASRDGTVGFAPPQDAEEGSFRAPARNEAASGSWESWSLRRCLDIAKSDCADLIKLDIEGFEFEVLEALTSRRVRCRQLLVEFHYGKKQAHSFWEHLNMLIRLRLAGYRLIHRKKADHTFLQTSSDGSR
jgi:FkbM family methyltransferase